MWGLGIGAWGLGGVGCVGCGVWVGEGSSLGVGGLCVGLYRV